MSRARLLVALLLLPAAPLLAAACAPSDGTGHVASAETAQPAAPSVALLPARSQAALRATPVRMLLLPAEYAPATIVTSGPHWAALSWSQGGLTLSLHATNVEHDVLSADELAHVPAPQARVRGVPARVTMNEQVRSLSFRESGVDYTLDVECRDAFGDTRCTGEAFVLALADRLEVAP